MSLSKQEYFKDSDCFLNDRYYNDICISREYSLCESFFFFAFGKYIKIILKTRRLAKWERNDTHAEYLVSVYISIVDSFSPDSLPQDFTQSRSYVHSPENETTSVEVPARLIGSRLKFWTDASSEVSEQRLIKWFGKSCP